MIRPASKLIIKHFNSRLKPLPFPFMKSKLLLLSLLITSMLVNAQTRDISGTVTDRSDGSAIVGANITVKGTATGTATDANGRFNLKVVNDASTLIVSFIGYETLEVNINGQSVIDISLNASTSQLEEVVISTGRGSQRTITDTPLPIDNFVAADLKTTGQVSFDKALQYRVPSFNTVNTPVNDATSLFDPYELRNLGPSRTLILINGKRKNLTSLVYTQSGLAVEKPVQTFQPFPPMPLRALKYFAMVPPHNTDQML